MTRARQGFSLVELSIVLVILGLLTGGILGGRALIQAAELRSVTQEFRQWQTAVNTFQLKYGGLPGDSPDAHLFLGENTSCPAYSTTGVCSGNGDGIVSRWNYSAACAGASNAQERMQFWRHLSSSELIPGDYSGSSIGGSAPDPEPGVFIPASKMGNMVWQVSHASACTRWAWGGTPNPDRKEQGNALMLGTYSPNMPTLTSILPGGELRPEDAYQIDMKMDDGKPGTGTIRALLTEVSNGTAFTWCANTNDATAASTAEYNFLPADGVTPRCALYFPKAF